MITMEELLALMVRQGGSDLHVTVASPPRIRVDGNLLPVECEPLTPDDTRRLATSVLNSDQIATLDRDLELDCSFGLAEHGRFRANVFYQQGSVGAVMRLIPFELARFEGGALQDRTQQSGAFEGVVRGAGAFGDAHAHAPLAAQQSFHLEQAVGLGDGHRVQRQHLRHQGVHRGGAIEDEIRGLSADERRDARDQRSRPIIGDLYRLLEARGRQVSAKSRLGEAIRYTLPRWDGLTRFLDDGRIDLDNNAVERAIRPLALNRKNALFAGSDEGGDNWAVIATLIENCKLTGINPHTWLTATLISLANGHALTPNTRQIISTGQM